MYPPHHATAPVLHSRPWPPHPGVATGPGTPPAVWVLAAIGLMGVLAASSATCGVVVGLSVLPASSDAPGEPGEAAAVAAP